MNLQEFTSQTKKTKEWLKIVCNTIDATNITADGIESQLLTFDNVASVPNPAVGSLTLFSNASGELSSTDPLGTTVTYTTSAIFADALLQVGPTVTGNLPMYVDNVSLNVQDSGINSANVFLADGSVVMSGDLDMNLNNILNVTSISTATPSNNVLIGNGASSTNNNTVNIGLNTQANGLNAVAIGNSSNAGIRGVAIGSGAIAAGSDSCSVGRSAQGAGSNQSIFGSNSTCNASQYACCFGQAVHSNAFAALTFGAGNNNTTNSTAQSVLFGDSLITNIRPDNSSLCDLGVDVTNRFRNLYADGCLLGSSNRPADVGMFSQYADVNINNTVVETTMVSGSAVGSLLLNPSPLGAMFDFSISFLVSSVAGDNLDVRWYSNAGILFTNNLVVPALAVNLPVTIYSKVIVRNGNIYVTSTSEISGLVSTIVGSAIVYDRTINNQWDVTAQWGANVNQLSVGMLNLRGSYSGTS